MQQRVAALRKARAEFARRADVDRDTWVLGINDRQMIDRTWDGRGRWSTSTA